MLPSRLFRLTASPGTLSLALLPLPLSLIHFALSPVKLLRMILRVILQLLPLRVLFLPAVQLLLL